MTGNMNQKDDFFSANDALDINELASLNEDISAEFIEQLQSNITQSVSGNSDDSTLFEDVNNPTKQDAPKFDQDIDDNFIKKYQAKIKKQKLGIDTAAEEEKKHAEEEKKKEDRRKELLEQQRLEEQRLEEQTKKEKLLQEKIDEQQPSNGFTTSNADTNNVQSTASVETKANNTSKKNTKSQEKEIETLSGGNIVEKPVQDEQLKYNESLDYLDDNVKYSKYVIYIEPENTEFIESLTVKERKNLINRLLREQDDIAITKRRLSIIQAFIKHSIIAIITIAISIPIVYYTVNASLEASINNYRRSKAIFKTLYKEKGKIRKINKY